MTVLNTRPLIVAYDENRHLKYQQVKYYELNKLSVDVCLCKSQPEITTKNQYLIRSNEGLCNWMDGQMDGWMDRWMDGQMDGWMDG